MSLMKWLQYWEKRDEIESKGMNNDDTISIKREREQCFMDDNIMGIKNLIINRLCIKKGLAMSQLSPQKFNCYIFFWAKYKMFEFCPN